MLLFSAISAVKKKLTAEDAENFRRVRWELVWPRCHRLPNLLIFSVRSLIRLRNLNDRYFASGAKPLLPMGGPYLHQSGPGRELLHLRQHQRPGTYFH